MEKTRWDYRGCLEKTGHDYVVLFVRRAGAVVPVIASKNDYLGWHWMGMPLGIYDADIVGIAAAPKEYTAHLAS